jgi:hypothetical protein
MNETIHTALLQALNQIPAIPKDAMGHHGPYSSLEMCLEVIKPVLAKNGLFLTQSLGLANDGLNVLITRIHHDKSGEAIESLVKLTPDGPGPQKLGAAITYMRRYALLALVGVASEGDPDGSAVSSHGPAYKPHSYAQERAAPVSLPQQSMANPSDWKIPFGKFRGMRVGDVPINELANYAAWLQKDAGKSGKPLSDDASHFIAVVREMSNESAHFADDSSVPF